jgi:ribonuclease Z
MHDVITGYSRGMFSNWLYHRQLQIVVDAGEGLQLALGSRVLAPTHLLITHGHSDHLLGLIGFVAARRFGIGAPDKPLTILHPAGSPAVEVARGSLARLWPTVEFPLTWVPVLPGAEVPLTSNRIVEAFAADHPAHETALGYRVVEQRRRLKAEFRALAESEIRAIASAGGRERLTEHYRHPLFVHSGDSMPIPVEVCRGADLLVHDATFVDPTDRRANIHATTAEVFTLAREAGVRRLVLQHVSIRYERDGLAGRLAAQARAAGYMGECWWLDDGRLVRLST